MNRLQDFAQAIARHEGFYKNGTVPQRLNNPGDLVAGIGKYYGRMKSTWKNPASGLEFGVYLDAEDGWNDLKDYLRETIQGQWRGYRAEAAARAKKVGELTLEEYFGVYAPVGWQNQKAGLHIPNKTYAESVAQEMGVSPSFQIGVILAELALQTEKVATPAAIKIENQLDPKWARYYMGRAKGYSFRDNACYLFSLTFLFSVLKGQQISPAVVDKLFMDNGVYSGPSIISERAAAVLGLQYFGKETNIDNPPNWSPSIKEVDFSIRAGKQQHFVVRCEDESGKYILDPYEGVRRPVNEYELKVGYNEWNKQMFSYRKFKIPNK